MTHWIRQLAQHYEAIRRRAPDAALALVFDIDGTILDVEPAARSLLECYAEAGGQDLLSTAREADVAVADWPAIVASAGLRGEPRDRAVAELRRLWNQPDTVLAAHRPCRGTLEVIRWFQLQPNTEIALNTGRPASQRLDTLRQLNSLGRAYRVSFSSDLLFMRDDADRDATAAKVRGIDRLRARGYTVVAAVDNEPRYLQAIKGGAPEDALLTFHSRDLHAARRSTAPDELRELLSSRRLPRHVQFVWEGIHGEGELQRFLTAAIHWGEVTLSGFHAGEPIIGGGRLQLTRALSAMLQRTRRCKIKLRAPEQALALIPWLRERGYPSEALWFHLPAGPHQAEALRRLSEAMPGSMRQCPIDGLSHSEGAGPDLESIAALARAGATRFSMDWQTPGTSQALDVLDAHGYELHLHAIPDMAAFIQASLLLPCSVGTGFDFPHRAGAAQHRRAS